MAGTKRRARRQARRAKQRVRRTSTKRVRRTPEQARALILEAARTVFADVGPDAAGLKDVAREAGVSHGLVTHYFGTFDGLVEATMEEHLAALRARLLERLGGADSLSLSRFIDGFFEIIEDPLHGRLVQWAILSGRYEAEDFFPRRERGSAQVVDAVLAWLASRGSKGVEREDVELSLILVITAGIGYGMGRSLWWASLGHRATRARDARFRKLLADVVDRQLHAKLAR